jgi:hypothetical protein
LVTLCLPGNEGTSRTLSGFPRFAQGGDMVALGLLFTPGTGCSQSIFRRDRLPYAPTHSYQPFRVLNITKPHQGFIYIIPSNLALALAPGFGSRLVGHLTSSADTALPLLVEHSEADICLNTGREGLWGILPTPPNDFESRA